MHETPMDPIQVIREKVEHEESVIRRYPEGTEASEALADARTLLDEMDRLRARIRRHRDTKLEGAYMASERRAYAAGERDPDDHDHHLWAVLDDQA